MTLVKSTRPQEKARVAVIGLSEPPPPLLMNALSHDVIRHGLHIIAKRNIHAWITRQLFAGIRAVALDGL